MAKEIPFDDDVMTLIMGLGGPEEPGQHGRTHVPAPENKAVDVITQIRDLCVDFLKNAGKEEEKPEEKKEEDSEKEPTDMKIDED